MLICGRENCSRSFPLFQLTGNYPTVAKQIRDFYKNQMKEHKHDDEHEHHHCCGFMALEQGLGHEDLDKLMRNPEELDFTFGKTSQFSSSSSSSSKVCFRFRINQSSPTG